jgi:hypothetical protein
MTIDNTADTNEEAVQIHLSVEDIESAVKIIDHAAEQGAFKGWGLIQDVLVIRNKLVHFIRSTQIKIEPAAADAGADEAK